MKIYLFFLSALTAVPIITAQWLPNCVQGRRTIISLFEWRWDDIALECERFLAPKGYCGVQVSPPSENLAYYNENVAKRPWWERYQPVSYKIYSRSGDENGFIDMVKRCNNVGVRIYADAVFNHMTGGDAGKGAGVGGTPYDASVLSFPGVPYSNPDFNSKISYPSACPSASGNIENYNDATQVRNCRLVGLLDISQGKTYVQDRIVEYMNRLIRIGVAGFRIDAAKHMWPGDLTMIFKRLENASSTWFFPNSRPFIYQEVIDYGGEAIKADEYFSMGRVTEFKYGSQLSMAFRGMSQIKNLKTLGPGWGGLMTEPNAFVFIDNHDLQRGGGSNAVATFWEPRLYKMCVTFMLAWPYGISNIMSSYSWPRNFVNGQDQNSWFGPPHDVNYNTQRVTINADGTCGNGWVCEHRWRQIYNMVKFRNVAASEPVENWWDDGDNQIAFSRGNTTFYIINSSTWKTLDATLQTGLAEGRYCDIISGNISADKRSCTGSTITVGGDGKARFAIGPKVDDPMIAIHVESKLS